MRKTSSTYQNSDGQALTIEAGDGLLTIAIDGVVHWTVEASESSPSVGERQARAIARELVDWAEEAYARRMDLRKANS